MAKGTVEGASLIRLYVDRFKEDEYAAGRTYSGDCLKYEGCVLEQAFVLSFAYDSCPIPGRPMKL